MKLYFLRHAEAEDGPIDAERELTAKGRRDAQRMGRYLRELGVRFDHAFTSPLVRARQTAERVLACCQPRRQGCLEETDVLLNETRPAAFLRWLSMMPDGSDSAILLVGHEPSLSGWVRHLVGMPRGQSLTLAKGALARVDTEDRRSGELRLLLGPKHLP